MTTGGGETAKDPSAWNVDTLKAHFEQRFVDQEKAVKAALDAAALAVDRAEQNAEKWRANANEWRAAMIDRETKFSNQGESDSRFTSVDARLTDIRRTFDERLSEIVKSVSSMREEIAVSRGRQAAWAGAIAIAFSIVTIVARFL